MSDEMTREQKLGRLRELVSVVAHAVSLVSSLVTGEPPQAGENEKLELK